MVGVHEAHEPVMDFGELVIVEGGGEFRGFGEGQGLMAEDSEGSTCVNNLEHAKQESCIPFGNVKNPECPPATECFS